MLRINCDSTLHILPIEVSEWSEGLSPDQPIQYLIMILVIV
jgi:hypothetical protein